MSDRPASTSPELAATPALDAHSASAPSGAEPAKAVAALPVVPTSTKNLTILLVEDDRMTRLMMARPLETSGYRVLQSSRLSEARDVVATEAVDAIVVDGLLPDGTGMDFISELRGRGILKPVLFLSSFFRDMTSFNQLRRDLKVAAVLYKPLTAAELLQQVEELFDVPAAA
jgi:DNA-binding response OmpR family regulator